MTAWMLTSNVLHEPWTLWTSHLAHHSWQHAADNSLALIIPFLLAHSKDRKRLALWLFLLAPFLSLALLPTLEGGAFGGISGLACAAWVLVGVQLMMTDETLPVGLLMLGLLAAKFTVESMTGSGLLSHAGRWQSISDSHIRGALLGLAAAMLDDVLRRFERKVRCCATRNLRRWVMVPR